jgi:hypothetical protein
MSQPTIQSSWQRSAWKDCERCGQLRGASPGERGEVVLLHAVCQSIGSTVRSIVPRKPRRATRSTPRLWRAEQLEELAKNTSVALWRV